MRLFAHQPLLSSRRRIGSKTRVKSYATSRAALSPFLLQILRRWPSDAASSSTPHPPRCRARAPVWPRTSRSVVAALAAEVGTRIKRFTVRRVATCDSCSCGLAIVTLGWLRLFCCSLVSSCRRATLVHARAAPAPPPRSSSDGGGSSWQLRRMLSGRRLSENTALT
jgi:hypothetical protein